MKFVTRLLAGTALLAAAAPVLAQTTPPTPAPAGQPQRPAQPPASNAPAPAATQEVVVTGQPSGVRTSIDRLSYSVANDLQTSSGSVADALRNVPGVEVDVQGNVSLRGDGNVTVMVDGRPSGAFRGEGRADALSNFPANQIERVEVITNPNAAMSPEGTAGVINLITKQNRRGGTTGSARASIGTEGRWNVGVSGTKTEGKLTLSGDLGYRANGGVSEGFTIRDRVVGADTIQTRTTSDSDSGGGFRNARLSADYDLDKATRLSAELGHRAFKYEGEGIATYETDAPGGGLALAYNRPFEIEFERGGTDLRTSYRKRFGETAATGSAAAADHELGIDLTLQQNKFTNRSDARFTDQFPAQPESVERFTSEILSDEARLKVEYAQPYEGGLKTRYGYEGAVTVSEYDNFGARGPTFATTTPVAAFTNAFTYDQAVHALFGILERPFGKFTVQGGLRLEQVDIEIDQITAGLQESNDYFRAYPTVFFAYDLADGQRMRASYSRRIQRPQPYDLNPYRVYIDPNNLREGNPNLEPEITDSFEASWQKRAGPTFYLATLFYRQSSDGITDVIQDLGNNIFLTTRENLSESRRTGLEVVANGRLTKTLTYNASATALYNEIDVRSAAFTGTRDGTSIGGRLNMNWQPTANDFFQVSGFWQGDQLQAQGTREASGMLNLGYRRKINDKLSLVLTANNVLDTFKERIVTDTPAFNEITERTFMNPSLFVGLNWTFGDTSGQQQQRRRPQEPGFDYEGGGGPGR